MQLLKSPVEVAHIFKAYFKGDALDRQISIEEILTSTLDAALIDKGDEGSTGLLFEPAAKRLRHHMQALSHQIDAQRLIESRKDEVNTGIDAL